MGGDDRGEEADSGFVGLPVLRHGCGIVGYFLEKERYVRKLKRWKWVELRSWSCMEWCSGGPRKMEGKGDDVIIVLK